MVIWLSGAYGVGKSTVARSLSEKLPNTILFDAEEVGNAVRGSYPNCPCGYIFEDYPLWSEFCRQLIHDVHSKFDRNILVDMTLVRESSRVNIIDRLRADGIEVHYIVLTASRQTIHDRILARGEEEDCWCMENLDMAMRDSALIPGSVTCNTDGVTIEEVADTILRMIERGGAADQSSNQFIGEN